MYYTVLGPPLIGPEAGAETPDLGPKWWCVASPEYYILNLASTQMWAFWWCTLESV
jgi:hypothetical protein